MSNNVKLTSSKDGLLRISRRVNLRIGLEELVIAYDRHTSKEELIQDAITVCLTYYNEGCGLYFEDAEDKDFLLSKIRGVIRLFPEYENSKDLDNLINLIGV